jgi:hypothetical protein
MEEWIFAVDGIPYQLSVSHDSASGAYCDIRFIVWIFRVCGSCLTLRLPEERGGRAQNSRKEGTYGRLSVSIPSSFRKDTTSTEPVTYSRNDFNEFGGAWGLLYSVRLNRNTVSEPNEWVTFRSH